MPASDEQFAQEYLTELKRLLGLLDASRLAEAIAVLRSVRDAGGTVFICGNGGSAAIASQMVVDLVKGASFGRPRRFKMLALSDNTATLTAYANDEGYDAVFVEPLKNFAQPGDVLIALSCSGESANVLQAVEYANQLGCRTIGLTNAESGRLRGQAQLVVPIPTQHMGRLEDCFFIITHLLAYAFIDGEE